MDEGARNVQLELIAEINALLRAEGLAHWLYGGWGIDFLVGDVTREHHDIDYVVWARDSAQIRALLEEHGYAWQLTRHTDERHVFMKRGQRIDIDFIEQAGTGQIVTPGRWKDWPWPEGAFGDRTATLAAITCPVVSPEAQLDSKESFQHYAPGSTPRAEDEADILRLRATLAAQRT